MNRGLTDFFLSTAGQMQECNEPEREGRTSMYTSFGFMARKTPCAAAPPAPLAPHTCGENAPSLFHTQPLGLAVLTGAVQQENVDRSQND